jgi:preprotein translocase subunit SecA
MQIVGPDGQPLVIPSRPRPAIPPAPAVSSAEASLEHSQSAVAVAERPVVPIPTRQPSTTIDEIEKEFERKKRRELEHARMAGSASAEAPAQRRTGDKVGRNDPCPCGSGKKYKKCHGAGEA